MKNKSCTNVFRSDNVSLALKKTPNQTKTLLQLVGWLLTCLPVFPMEVFSLGLKQWE